MRRTLPVVIALLLAGCSVRRFAINKLGDALASGGSTYESDEDLQLAARAIARRTRSGWSPSPAPSGCCSRPASQ